VERDSYHRRIRYHVGCAELESAASIAKNGVAVVIICRVGNRRGSPAIVHERTAGSSRNWALPGHVPVEINWLKTSAVRPQSDPALRVECPRTLNEAAI